MFFNDLAFSSSRAEKYWAAIQKRALTRLESFNIKTVELSNEQFHKKSSAWSVFLYTTDEKLSSILKNNDVKNIFDIEKNCFNNTHLVDAPLWKKTLQPIEDGRFIYASDSPLGGEPPLIEALEIIEKSWPEGFAEFKILIRGCAWIYSARIESFSDPKLFGIIHLRRNLKMPPFLLALDVVHETAHHAFFIETSIDPILLNPSQELYSSMQRKNRPAIGVFHAAVAIGRMLIFCKKVIQTPGFDTKTYELAKKSYDNCIHDQLISISEIKKTPLTATGVKCFNEIIDSFEQITNEKVS